MLAHGQLIRGLTGSLLVLVVSWGALVATPAVAADGVPLPEPGHPWFGPGLDWDVDSPDAYAERLGETPSLYTHRVGYPLSADDESAVVLGAQAAADQGAALVLDLQPVVPLEELVTADAVVLASLVTAVGEDGAYLLLRFAPEMNGSWPTWGQQPVAYVEAFRTIADSVHAATDRAAMVWSPVYGSGYPFREAYGDLEPVEPEEIEALDTTGDGVVSLGDDPYGPYFPGDDVVDWVGLTLYRFGPEAGGRTDPQPERNTRPRSGEYAERLAETFGYDYGAGRRSFYERFAKPSQRPVLVETGALHHTDEEGATPYRLKRPWWRQVFKSLDDHPLIAGVSWLEQVRTEEEVGDDVGDWRATATPRLSRALREDLVEFGLDLGPLSDGGGSGPPEVTASEPVGDPPDDTSVDPSAGSEPEVAVGPEANEVEPWMLVGAAVLGLMLLVGAVWSRRRGRQRRQATARVIAQD